MATNTLNVRMKQAVRTEAEWTSDNPVLLEGEVAYSSDKNNMYKVGDGTSRWNALPYNKIYTNQLVPIETHTYTDLIASENTEAKGNFYWATIMPDNYDETYVVRYRITAWIPNYATARTISEVTVFGVRNTFTSFSCFNSIISTSYRPIYQNLFYWANEAGINNGYGHAIGTRIASSWSPTNTSYKRNFTIELLEATNCTVTFLETPVLYENLSGKGSTNYNVLTNLDAANNGLRESGDDNSINEYAGGITAGANGIKAYALAMKIGEDIWESVITSASTTASTKIKNPNGFLITSPIIYCNGNYNSGVVSSNSATYFAAWAFDTRYSFNVSGSSWSANGRPLYLVGTITKDDEGCSRFYLKDTTWWATNLPTSADGYYYWYIGQMISGYQAALHAYHPIYYYDNGIKQYNITEVTEVNGHTVNADVPSGAKFTDTVTTATTTGSGNAVTAITASNGALTVTKGTTFLTSHQDISGKADKSATVSNVAWDSTNKKLTKTINGTTSDVVTAATLRSAINVADGAEVNQNAFSNIKVGSTTIASDSKTDTLELVAGSNVTLTPDATNDKVTIAATDTTYSSKAAASGGTDVSLVTTGEKYTWNNKLSSVPIASSSTLGGIKVGDGLSIAADGTLSSSGGGGTNIGITYNPTDETIYITTGGIANGDEVSY